jgi:hypothetical protein
LDSTDCLFSVRDGSWCEELAQEVVECVHDWLLFRWNAGLWRVNCVEIAGESGQQENVNEHRWNGERRGERSRRKERKRGREKKAAALFEWSHNRRDPHLTTAGRGRLLDNDAVASLGTGANGTASRESCVCICNGEVRGKAGGTTRD